MHTFHLDTSSRKHTCPQCGRRTLVAYVDDSGRMLNPEAGRCDRQNKCAYHRPPRHFLPRHRRHDAPRTWLHRKLPTPPRRVPAVPSYILPAQVKSTIGHYGSNSLVRWLKHTFRHHVEPQAVEEMAALYGVGTARIYGGSPIYWQLDTQGRARTGKIMGYDPATGRRVKHPRPQLSWVHKLGHAATNSTAGSDFHLRQVLFGSHLARIAPAATIMLMESEKAALVMALTLAWGEAFGNFLPMATGGCSNLPADSLRGADPYGMLAALRGRKTILLPDAGMYDKWLERSRPLAPHCKLMGVATVMEPDRRRFIPPFETHSGDGPDDLILQCLATGMDPTLPIVNLL